MAGALAEGRFNLCIKEILIKQHYAAELPAGILNDIFVD
jgi:hypothetical protein